MNNRFKFYAFISIAGFSFSSIASENQITHFCSQESVNQQHRIEVGEITSLKVLDGPYMLLEKPSQLSISQEYLRAELTKISLPEGCQEYLLSQAGFTTYENGDLIARVYFDFDKSNLTSESKYILEQLKGDLEKSDTNLLLDGNTDSIGSESYNIGLGLRRADAVAHHMNSIGADSSLLTTTSSGETNPISSNDSAAGRKENRRVDVIKTE